MGTLTIHTGTKELSFILTTPTNRRIKLSFLQILITQTHPAQTFTGCSNFSLHSTRAESSSRARAVATLRRLNMHKSQPQCRLSRCNTIKRNKWPKTNFPNSYSFSTKLKRLKDRMFWPTQKGSHTFKRRVWPKTTMCHRNRHQI